MNERYFFFLFPFLIIFRVVIVLGNYPGVIVLGVVTGGGGGCPRG